MAARPAPAHSPDVSRFASRLPFALLLPLALLANYRPAHAGSFSVLSENDTYEGISDDSYTQGLRLRYEQSTDWNMAPGLRLLAMPDILFMIREPHDRERQRFSAFSFGQRVYTPTNLESSERQLDDRPYAGWMFLCVEVIERSKKDESLLEFELGWTGPRSYAEKVQIFWHDYVVPSTHPNGWAYQLEEQVAFNVTYRRSHLFLRQPAMGIHAGYSAGLVQNSLNAGWLARLGRGGPWRGINPPGSWRRVDRYADERVAARESGDGKSESGERATGLLPFLYDHFAIVASSEARLVKRNMFLDGEYFNPTHRVPRRPFVVETRTGVYGSVGWLSLGYEAVILTPEMQTANEAHWYGSVEMAIGHTW